MTGYYKNSLFAFINNNLSLKLVNIKHFLNYGSNFSQIIINMQLSCLFSIYNFEVKDR